MWPRNVSADHGTPLKFPSIFHLTDASLPLFGLISDMRAPRCMRRQKSSKGQVKVSKQEQDAAKRREQMAAAAEARIARLKLVSEQQQLWCYMASCVLPHSSSSAPCDSITKRDVHTVEDSVNVSGIRAGPSRCEC